MNFEKPGYEGEKHEKSSFEIMKTLRELLEKLYVDNLLIAHQTHKPSAQKIMSDEYFSHSGLVGTALQVSVDDIMNVLPELDKNPSERSLLTHRGADSLVIMTFPRELFTGQKMNLDLVDGCLADLALEGKISQFGLPNAHVLGYYNEGGFDMNPDFNPQMLTKL